MHFFSTISVSIFVVISLSLIFSCNMPHQRRAHVSDMHQRDRHGERRRQQQNQRVEYNHHTPATAAMHKIV